MVNHSKGRKSGAVKSPGTLMSEVNFQEISDTEKDKMDELVQRYERLDPIRCLELGGKKINYSTPNLMTLGRVWNLFQAEPITIEWILDFNETDTMFDIGANVGIYGIFAAVITRARVFAFEPESQNFGLLTKNIIYNDLADTMTAWPIAISDELKFGYLNLWGFRAGNSHHFFGEELNFKLEKEDFPFIQGAVSTSIDTLVDTNTVPIPNHIKIDVDGIEHRVVRGAKNTLTDLGVRSILIEVNTKLTEHRDMVEEIEKLGFSFSHQQVKDSASKDPRHTGITQYLFKR